MDLGKGLHERLEISPERGELNDGVIRYLMMRPDALMGMFARLTPAARREALAALADSVAEFGGKSVAKYRESGAAEPDQLIQTMVRTSAELGWGLWEFSSSDDGEVHVKVRNSPFAHGSCEVHERACAPIEGILTAIAPVLAGDGASARETRCHSMTGDNICCFTLTR